MKKLIILTITISWTVSIFAQKKTSSSYIEKSYELLDKEDYNGALGTLNFAINEMPDSINLFAARGVLLEAFKEFKEAIKDFTVAIDGTDDPKYKAHLLSNRGGSKFSARDFVGGYNDLIEAVNLVSTNIDILNNLAVVCNEMDKQEENIMYLNRIIEIDPKYMPAYVNLGFKYQGLNQHKVALKYLDKAIKLSPDGPLGYSNRSFSRLKINDLKGTKKDINKSLKIFPGNSYAYKIRALIFIAENNIEEACADLDYALRLEYTKQYGAEVQELKDEHCK